MKKLTEQQYQELLRGISCYLLDTFDAITDQNNIDVASRKRLQTDLCYQAILNANQLMIAKIGPKKRI
jgi:hypothetical protein